MLIHLAIFTIVMVTTVLAGVLPAEACSCGGGPVSPAGRLRESAAVFVGRVESISRPEPISESKGNGVSVTYRHHPARIQFSITALFKGNFSTEVVLVSDDTCDFEGSEGQRYLVYAIDDRGRLKAPKCSAATIKPMEDANEDVKFLRNWLAGVPQALVYGYLHQRVVDREGRSALAMPVAHIDVVAEGPSGRYVVATPPTGTYVLVAPPGDYAVWAESDGVILSSLQRLSLLDGQEQLRTIVLDSRR